LQSNELRDPRDKEILLDMLTDPGFANAKKQVYMCLASLCGNLNDPTLFNFLMEKVKTEYDDSIKVVILSRMEIIEKDATYNLAPIKEALKEGTYDVMRAAARALSNAADPTAEDLLLAEFQTSDKHRKGTICGPLKTVGTTKSIPILREAYKKTRDGGLRATIEYTINAIEKRLSNP
jgi:HEAT repeat protein